MSKKICSLIILLLSIKNYAQQENKQQKKITDSIIQNEFPRTRNFNLEFDNSFSRKYDSELEDQQYSKGKITNQQIVNFSLNLPIYNYKKWTFSTSGNYKNFQFEFDDEENISNPTVSNYKHTESYNYFLLSLNSTYYGSIFKKPLLYNGSIIADGNNKGFQRLKGSISAVVVLKKTDRITMTAGLILFIDPTSQIPLAPVFTYNERFKNSKWELDVILPQRVSLRKTIGSKSRFTVGTFFGGENFYVDTNQSLLPSIYSYSQLKIDGGLIYEYKLSKTAIITIQGGARKYISNRLTEKQSTNSNYIYKNTQEMTGYINVGVSLNPFKS